MSRRLRLRPVAYPEMSRKLLLIVFALAAVSVAFVLSKSPGEVAQLGPPLGAVTEVDPIDVAPLEGTVSAGEPLRDDVGIARKTSSTFEANPQVFPRGGLLITALDLNTDEPMVGAKIVVTEMDRFDIDFRDLSREANMGQSGRFAYASEEFLTDDRGQVRVPLPNARVTLTASTSTHFDIMTYFPMADCKVLMRLEAETTVPVRVIDEAGHPLEGAPVSLRAYSRYRSQFYFPLTFTNADGRARLRATEAWKESPEGSKKVVSLEIFGFPRVEIPIDFDHLTEEEVVLEMPATGQVEVIILNEKGEPTQDAFEVTLRSYALSSEDWNRDMPSLLRRQTVEHGRALFSYVALGRELTVRAKSKKHKVDLRASLEGPSTRGVTATLRLDSGEGYMALFGRILPVEGLDIQNLSLRVEVHDSLNGGDSRQEVEIETDAQGHFKFPIKDRFGPGMQSSLVFVKDRTARTPRKTAVLDWSDTYGQGVFDLGDITLAPSPIVVAGRVIDAFGNPVRDALARLEWGRVANREGGAMQWQEIRGLATRTNKNGEFAMRFDLCAGRYRLVLAHTYLQAKPQEFRLNDADVLVHMQKQISVVGRVLVDREIDLNAIDLIIQHLDDSEEAGYTIHRGSFQSTFFSGKDGSFHVGKLLEGPAILRVQSHKFGMDLFVLDGLHLQADENQCIIPDIDLRGLLRQVSVSLVDEQGQRVKHGWIRFAGKGRAMSLQDGGFDDIVSETGLDFEIGAFRMRSVSLSGVVDDCEVVLQQGMPVSVILGNKDVVPEGMDISVAFFLPYPRENNAPFASQLKILSEGDFALLPGSGSYTLKFYAHEEKGGVVQLKLYGSSPTLLDIRDSGELQEYHVTIPEQALNLAVEDIKSWEYFNPIR